MTIQIKNGIPGLNKTLTPLTTEDINKLFDNSYNFDNTRELRMFDRVLFNTLSRAYKTYLTIKRDGYLKASKSVTHSSFYINKLEEIGISKDYLKSFKVLEVQSWTL